MIMVPFALSIFLSAFLLFQIQPMIGKFILPWFGGTPAVWSTVLLFFQVFLTGGYAYAYWLIGHVKIARQGIVHTALLLISITLLAGLGLVWPSPIMPGADWRPTDVNFPVFYILWILTVSVGLPYFILASNSPLMQAWFSKLFPHQSYARLYALSNFGSLIGLLAYPVLIEPNWNLQSQGWMWSGGFGLFAILVGVIAYNSRRVTNQESERTTNATPSHSEKPSSSLRALWIALSAIASIFLLSVTNQISQEVAVIPFLWIIPLAIYMLSFILTFSDARWYQHRLLAILFVLASGEMLWTLAGSESLNILLQVSVYSILLFISCMICHGELYKLHPSAEHLTSFYLMVSVGGAVGGVFVNLVAPFVFTGNWEFFLAWLLTFATLTIILLPKWFARHNLKIALLFIVFITGTFAFMFGIRQYQNSLFVDRNFYGVIRVYDWQSKYSKQIGFAMIHGVTVHGIQYNSQEFRDRPTTYYVEDSGVGLILLNHPRHGKGMRVGVLGLGAGTLAVYGEPGDTYTFYEINPTVIDLANGKGGYFSFLRDSRADIKIVPGDARISLEHELANGQDQNFDVLVLDTFDSDSIPVHLITKEAFALYLEHLALDGVIAAQISNRYLDLQPILWRLAQEYHLSILRVDRPIHNDDDGFPSTWILLARDPSVLDNPVILQHSFSLDGYSTTLRMWTDDYSNLFQILK